MREPRYRFPDHVRSTTRTIATRMVQEGTAARTPEELEAWIEGEPDIRESLEAGGYGARFTAEDLFPLLQAMLAKEGAPARSERSAPRRSQANWWLAGIVAVVLLVLVLLLTAADTAPTQAPGLDAGPPPAVLMQGDP